MRRGARPKISLSDLTVGERVLMVVWTAAAGVLPVAGIVLAVISHGTGRAIGIVLLLLGLIAAAVPISPVMRPRVERRIASQDQSVGPTNH
jgi:hypothetical protein